PPGREPRRARDRRGCRSAGREWLSRQGTRTGLHHRYSMWLWPHAEVYILRSFAVKWLGPPATPLTLPNSPAFYSVEGGHGLFQAPRRWPMTAIRIGTTTLAACALAVALASAATAQQPAKPTAAAGDTQPTLLGQYGDWGAYTAAPGGAKVCFAFA